MRPSTFIRTIGLVLLLLPAVGCGPLRQPPPAKAFYLLDIQPESQPQRLSPAVCFRVRTVSVQSPFSGTSLIYRTSETAYQRDYYNQFLVPADQQLGEALAAWLPAVGVVLCPDAATQDQTERLTLEPHLEALYTDFRNPESPSAYVRLRFAITTHDRSCRCSRILLNESFEATVNVPANPTAEQLVEAMSRAVAEAFGQFHSALESLFP